MIFASKRSPSFLKYSGFMEPQMPAHKFRATLKIPIPLVIKEIIKRRNVSEQEAFELLHSSFLYSKLELDSTKLWYLGQLILANLLNKELGTGIITFPEETKQ